MTTPVAISVPNVVPVRRSRTAPNVLTSFFIALLGFAVVGAHDVAQLARVQLSTLADAVNAGCEYGFYAQVSLAGAVCSCFVDDKPTPIITIDRGHEEYVVVHVRGTSALLGPFPALRKLY